jgi:crotonobetainyl-CoA:carnitine CoA-transferase CaiB-like acyl-CoA transferase
MHRLLNNVRILDFGRFIAAPYCGLLLADMGADVIRVERPGGDEDRRLGLKASNNENLLFPSMGRNKRGITLELSDRRAREVLADLISHADVLLHNFSASAAVGFGLDYASVRAIRPDIVYTAVSCFGSQGPQAKRTGFDPMAQMQSGAASLTGFDDAPLRSGVPWVDYSTGLCAALGTVAALRHRDLTGEGQEVQCALLQTAVSFTTPMIAEALTAGRERPRLGNRAPYLGPTDLFECLDGRVYVSAASESMWRALTRLIGRPELAEAEELSTDERRFENRGQIDGLVRQWAATRTVAEATRALDAARIPCATYRTTAEVADDPQVQACGMVGYADLEQPGFRRVPVSAFPIRFSGGGPCQTVRAPRPGEHNEEIYRQLVGYGGNRYEELRQSGLI